MPKISGSSSSIGSSSKNNGGILKRNQACHQCRRRKLVGDAKRPCSTCVRSHAHALDHAQDGSNPPDLECTFDEAPDLNIPVTSNETPKNRFERLESRIRELEALLKDKQDLITSLSEAGVSVNHPQSSISSSFTKSCAQSLTRPVVVSQITDILEDACHTELFARNGSFSITGAFEVPMGVPMDSAVYWPNWPPNLPHPVLLLHIVKAFFAFHPHATRLLNMSTFLTSLLLPPDHPDFPLPPVLHAICAVGSLYTVANRQQFEASATDFAEQQMVYAKSQIDKYLMSGQELFQCLQATIVLSWYYWSHARWIELFVSAGQSLRIAVPLGLNLCPPFHALNTTEKSMAIIPTPRTLAEGEIRRNAFWLAYAIDRQYGAGNGWAMSLDDNDIAQLLPLPRAKINAGIPIDAEHRQWSHLCESYLVHPPEITDSFTIYVKVMLVISRIKNFNHRFRVLEHLGDPGSRSTRMTRWDKPDVRSTATFSQLDDLVVSFRSSLSHDFKDPFLNDCLDPHLYTTHLALHASTILLHEPHSKTENSTCTSAMRILHAARGILDLVHVVLSTNYDLGLLDLFCPFCWFLAGRVFGRFLKAAQDASSDQQIGTLQVELKFIQTALGKMGERMPLSARYQKMLDTCIFQVCGPATTTNAPVSGISISTVEENLSIFRVAQSQTLAYDFDPFVWALQ